MEKHSTKHHNENSLIPLINTDDHPSVPISHYFDNYAPSELTDSYRVLSTPSSFARSTLLYIQEIGKLKSLKSHTSRRESLDSYLFVIVLSGSGIFTYERQSYPIKPRDHVFIDCSKPYSHQSSETDPWELMWVHFNGTSMNRYYSYFYRQANSIVLNPENPENFIVILEQLMELSTQKGTDSELLASHLINGLVTKILTNKEGNKNKNTNTDKMKQTKDFIDENFQKKITLDMIVEKSYISKYHMSREFKKAYGVTVVNYILTKRITHAKELLRFTDMQIEKIGRMCGIEDNSYFNKVFRKIEEMTASEYRKMWRGDQ